MPARIDASTRADGALAVQRRRHDDARGAARAGPGRAGAAPARQVERQRALPGVGRREGRHRAAHRQRPRRPRHRRHRTAAQVAGREPADSGSSGTSRATATTCRCSSGARSACASNAGRTDASGDLRFDARRGRGERAGQPARPRHARHRHAAAPRRRCLVRPAGARRAAGSRRPPGRGRRRPAHRLRRAAHRRTRRAGPHGAQPDAGRDAAGGRRLRGQRRVGRRDGVRRLAPGHRSAVAGADHGAPVAAGDHRPEGRGSRRRAARPAEADSLARSQRRAVRAVRHEARAARPRRAEHRQRRERHLAAASPRHHESGHEARLHRRVGPGAGGRQPPHAAEVRHRRRRRRRRPRPHRLPRRAVARHRPRRRRRPVARLAAGHRLPDARRAHERRGRQRPLPEGRPGQRRAPARAAVAAVDRPHPRGRRRLAVRRGLRVQLDPRRRHDRPRHR